MNSTKVNLYPNAAHWRILIADDEVPMAETMRNMVSSWFGCHVVMVHDGDAVIAQLDREPADVVLLDMVMPGMPGMEILEQLAVHWPQTDVIVVTGHSEAYPYVSVIHAGADDFISKPFHPTELEAKLVRLFRERQTRTQLSNAECTYRSIFELNTNGMLFLDAALLTIVDVNEAFCEVSGYSRLELLGRFFPGLLDANEQARFTAGIQLCAVAGRGTLGDFRIIRSDPVEIFVDITVTSLAVAEPKTLCLAFRDTTEQRNIADRLAQAAQLDELTGLYNRRVFNSSLERATNQAARGLCSLVLMMIDLDNFKQCNDRFGHSSGDQLLQSVGELINSNIRRGSDEGFRYGGDEFAVLLYGADAKVACRIGERMRSAYASVNNFNTSLSIGIAEFKLGMTSSAFAKTADEVLYRAKAQGKNALCIA